MALVALLHHNIIQELTFSANSLIVSFENAFFRLTEIARMEDTFVLAFYAFLPHPGSLGSLICAFIIVNGLCKGELFFQVLAKLNVLVGLIITVVLL